MSLRIKLTINNREYSLLQFSYVLKQETDSIGRPLAEIKCGFINLLVNATNNTGFVEKMADTDTPLQGKITYYDIVSDKKVREIEFSDGYIVSYEESFNTDADVICTEKIIISAQNLRVEKARFSNNWLL